MEASLIGIYKSLERIQPSSLTYAQPPEAGARSSVEGGEIVTLRHHMQFLESEVHRFEQHILVSEIRSFNGEKCRRFIEDLKESELLDNYEMVPGFEIPIGKEPNEDSSSVFYALYIASSDSDSGTENFVESLGFFFKQLHVNLVRN